MKNVNMKTKKIRLNYYCNGCESEFSVYIKSEGVKYSYPNCCPVCGGDHIDTMDDETEYDVEDFE